MKYNCKRKSYKDLYEKLLIDFEQYKRESIDCFADQAVKARERQIGALLDQMLDEDHPKAFYKAVVQIREFLYPVKQFINEKS